MLADDLYIFFIGYTFAIGWINLYVGLSHREDRSYLYFGLLSLFASIFLSAQLLPISVQGFTNLTSTISVVTACSFYGLFLWFIGEYTGFKRKQLQLGITILIVIVLMAYFPTRSSRSLEMIWEGLAHITILTISIYGIIGGLKIKSSSDRFWKYVFILMMGVLLVLTMVVGLSYTFNLQIIPDPEGYISPLDFFPIGFSIIMGSKMSHDILRSFRLEKEIKLKDVRWSKLVEAVDMLMVELDLLGNIVWVNSYFKEFTGYSTKEVLGKNWNSILLKEKRSKANGTLESFVEGENPVLRYDISTKNGHPKSIQWSNIPIRNINGNTTGILNIGVDVTEREQTLLEIQLLKDQVEKENLILKEKVKWQEHSHEIIGESDALNYVINRAHQVATTNSTVLLEGETGVGKELFAKLIHKKSMRQHKSLIKVNCAALPKDLIESELFGHEKGAFTGAINFRRGRFELADKGTLFLDEIGELPLDLQPKLLRVLQSGEFERVGSEKTIKVDVRVISATNCGLQEASDNGQFRQDLFFRLNVYPITIPPLRQRIEDLPQLVRHFAEKIGRKIGKNIKHISKADIKLLQSYDWPGNIRELENIIERAIINSVGDNLVIDRKQLNSSIQKNQIANNDTNLSLAETEKHHIISVLDTCNWKINGEKGAAEKLAMPPSTLRSKMKKLGIVRR